MILTTRANSKHTINPHPPPSWLRKSLQHCQLKQHLGRYHRRIKWTSHLHLANTNPLFWWKARQHPPIKCHTNTWPRWRSHQNDRSTTPLPPLRRYPHRYPHVNLWILPRHPLRLIHQATWRCHWLRIRRHAASKIHLLSCLCRRRWAVRQLSRRTSR